MPLFEQIKKAVASAEVIVISGHRNPDGDSLGSMLALGLGLKKLGKTVYMLCQDTVHSRYRFLPGVEKIVRQPARQADLAIAVDCSNKEVLGESFTYFQPAREIIEIDHHEFRRSFGTIHYIDHTAAAVGEMVYRVLQELGVQMDRHIAEGLLTSIIVETLSFRLPTVRPLTFELCSRLMQTGADFYKIADRVFWATTRQSVVLMGICLARCAFLSQGRIAWSILRENDFKAVGGTDADADPILEHMRSIGDVKIALLLREKDKKKLRVSIRSKGRRINVARIAERYLGGGHYNSAGCLLDNDPAAIRGFLSYVQRFLRENDRTPPSRMERRGKPMG